MISARPVDYTDSAARQFITDMEAAGFEPVHYNGRPAISVLSRSVNHALIATRVNVRIEDHGKYSIVSSVIQ